MSSGPPQKRLKQAELQWFGKNIGRNCDTELRARTKLHTANVNKNAPPMLNDTLFPVLGILGVSLSNHYEGVNKLF